MTVTGEAHIPSPPALVLHGGTDAAKDWGRRWPYLTVELYAAAKGYPVQPVVILQDPGDPTAFCAAGHGRCRRRACTSATPSNGSPSR